MIKSFGARIPCPTFALILGTLVVSCSEPPPKPVPALDPSKAVDTHSMEEVKSAPKPSKPGSLTRIPLGDLYQLVQKNAALIYDVRPKLIYKLGHVPGAISFPRRDFEADISKHEDNIRNANTNNTPVVIYCTDLACPDAMSVATALVSRGHSVSVLQGGYAAWKVAAP